MTPKVIMLGPRAQEVIRPFLCLDISGYLFSPKRVVAQPGRRASRPSGSRSSGIPTSNIRPRTRGTGWRSLRDRYDVNAYRRAIARACDKAFPIPTWRHPQESPDCRSVPELKAWQKSHHWHPHQFRHSAATTIRGQFGAEAAQAVLGHAELNTTEIYAERSLEAARQICVRLADRYTGRRERRES